MSTENNSPIAQTPTIRRPRRPEALKYGEKTVVMSIRLPISQAARLREIANDRGQSVNELVNELIKNLK